MPLIEQDDKNAFYAILRSSHFSDTDFELKEINAADPKSDEIDPLQGYVAVIRKSTQIAREYPLEYDVAWVVRFKKDLDNEVFG